MPPRLLAPETRTAEDVARLIEARTGEPCSRHRLRRLIRDGMVPQPVAVLGRVRLWTASQLKLLVASNEART